MKRIKLNNTSQRAKSHHKFIIQPSQFSYFGRLARGGTEVLAQAPKEAHPPVRQAAFYVTGDSPAGGRDASSRLLGSTRRRRLQRGRDAEHLVDAGVGCCLGAALLLENRGDEGGCRRRRRRE